MCYYNGVKVKKDEISFLIEDTRLIENFERDLQSGFDYQPYPIALKQKTTPKENWPIGSSFPFGTRT